MGDEGNLYRVHLKPNKAIYSMVRGLESLTSICSSSSTHRALRLAILAPSQSIKRLERVSSSSLHAASIYSRFEKRRVNV